MKKFDIREFAKKWPWFYYPFATIFGPVWWSGLSARAYFDRIAGPGKVLNIGSGAREFSGERVVNIDITPYKGVDIVASADSIPLPNQSVEGMIFDNVFEHLEKPQAAAKEISRLLITGGTVYIATPFLYPFHSSPHDYSRWTISGLTSLLGEDFEIIKSGVRCGPFSALTAFLSHLLATIFSFGNATVRALLFNVFMLPLIPLKILDVFAAHLPGAEEVAAVLYVVARKK